MKQNNIKIIYFYNLRNTMITEKLEDAGDTIIWNNLTVTVRQKRDFFTTIYKKFQKREYEETLTILKGGNIDY